MTQSDLQRSFKLYILVDRILSSTLIYFLLTEFNTVELFNNLDILRDFVRNICFSSFNISYLFSDGMTISSTFLGFASRSGFRFATFSVIPFPISSPIASAVS